MGLSDEVQAEFALSHPDTLKGYGRQNCPASLPHPSKYAGEMVEVAETFEGLGVTPFIHQGAEEIFNILARTPFAKEHAETIDRDRTLEQTISAMVEAMPPRAASPG